MLIYFMRGNKPNWNHILWQIFTDFELFDHWNHSDKKSNFTKRTQAKKLRYTNFKGQLNSRNNGIGPGFDLWLWG